MQKPYTARHALAIVADVRYHEEMSRSAIGFTVLMLLASVHAFADGCTKEKMKDYDVPVELTDPDQIECFRSYTTLMTFRQQRNIDLNEYLYHKDIKTVAQCKEVMESFRKRIPLISCSCGKLGLKRVSPALQSQIQACWDDVEKTATLESTTLPYRLEALEMIRYENAHCKETVLQN